MIMKLVKLDVSKDIKPNPYQPREKFNKEKLDELGDNIKAHGLIEPIVVCKKGDKYMIVAGERRWRAMQKVGIEHTYALDKTEDYKTEADMKRDSLVENEIRENLTNKEFYEFCGSLAKSLGDPVYVKGKGIDVVELTRYLLYGSSTTEEGVGKTKLYTRLNRLTKINNSGVVELKKSVDEDKIGLEIAAQIASIPDPKIQRELTELAAAKNHKQLAAELKRHNIQKDYEIFKETEKQSRDEKGKQTSEMKFVIKIIDRIDKWTGQLNLLNQMLSDEEKYFGKFTPENRLKIMDAMKPLSKEAVKLTEQTGKTLEQISR